MEISSTGPGGDFESKALKGSLAAPRRGDGLGLEPCPCELAVGRPLRIGTTSGMTCCCGGGGEKTAPTIGGVDEWSGEAGSCWFRLVSDCVLPAYIYIDELHVCHILDSDIHL